VKMCGCGNCFSTLEWRLPDSAMVCGKCGEPWFEGKDTIARKMANLFEWEEAPEAEDKMRRLKEHYKRQPFPPTLASMEEEAVVTR